MEQGVSQVTISWSRDTDEAVRSLLPRAESASDDLSAFVEDAVKRRLLHRSIQNMRRAFADVPPEELQRQIDHAVEEVRTARFERHPA